MAKIVIPDIGSGFNLNKINEAFQRIEEELNNNVLYRDNPEGEQNFMNNGLDMNQNNILNVGLVQAADFAFTSGKSIDDIIQDVTYWANQSEASAQASAQSADSSRVNVEDSAQSAFEASQYEVLAEAHKDSAQASSINAAASAVDAQTQAQAAAAYSNLGLSANTDLFDMGLVSDNIIIYPTDLGDLT